MSEIIIYNVDECDPPVLDTLIRAEFPALTSVTYDNLKTVMIALDLDPVTADVERRIRELVNEHSSAQAQVKAAAKAIVDAEVNDVNDRFNTSTLAGKSPAQIYAHVQGIVDGWTTLAQAKSSLRVLLPLMAASIAVKLHHREGLG